MRWARQAAGGLMILSLASCAHESEKHISGNRESTPQPAAFRVEAVPYEQIGGIEDTGVAGFRISIIRIAVGVGHTQEQIHETLRQVAEATARREDADQVLVFAYRSVDDISRPYNVARAAYDRDGEGVFPESRPFVVDLDAGYLTGEQAPLSQRVEVLSRVTLIRECYDDEWPFPRHDRAIVSNEVKAFRGTLRPAAIVELDGIRYGINSNATQVWGYPSAAPLLFRIQNPMKGVDLGKTCDAQQVE